MKNPLGVTGDFARAVPIRLLWLVSGWLPVRFATALGASLGAVIGPRLRKHSKVVANFRIALKSASEEELDVVARKSWRNTGAVLAELPHVHEIASSRVELHVAPEVQALIEAGEPMLFLSGHLANWEILHFVVAQLGCRFMGIYTPEPNPFVDRRLQSFRESPGCELVKKQDAVPRMLRARKERSSIGALADVRVDSGTLVPLFGIDTSTTIMPVRIALRTGCPVVPMHAERLPHARFRVSLEAPLRPAEGLAERAAAIDVTKQFHGLLERWILDDPAAWFCTKRRWPKAGQQPAG